MKLIRVHSICLDVLYSRSTHIESRVQCIHTSFMVLYHVSKWTRSLETEKKGTGSEGLQQWIINMHTIKESQALMGCHPPLKVNIMSSQYESGGRFSRVENVSTLKNPTCSSAVAPYARTQRPYSVSQYVTMYIRTLLRVQRPAEAKHEMPKVPCGPRRET